MIVLKYADIGASYGLIASASFALPKAIAEGSLTLDSLMISEHGISGRVSLGQYSETYIEDITPVKSFDIGDVMTFTVDGATADFTGSSFQINFSVILVKPLLQRKMELQNQFIRS